jgi:transposase
LDNQPRPCIPPEKKRRDRLIQRATQHPTWAIGFADEVWWSRLAQPAQHGWGANDAPIRLHQGQRATDDPDPKALACYGMLVCRPPQPAEQMLLRFVDGRPISAITTDFLAWCSQKLGAHGITALFLIWDNASWHVSQHVQQWLRTHNRTVKQTGQGVRFIVCRLPIKSPWLNPIEPKWVHGKRAVSEPTRVLTADELAERVCSYYGCAHEPHLTMPKKVD